MAAVGRRLQLSEVAFDELATRANIVPEGDGERWSLAETANVLIALEAGRPVGRGSENVVGQVNAFLNSDYGAVARGIVQQALTKFQPDL